MMEREPLAALTDLRARGDMIANPQDEIDKAILRWERASEKLRKHADILYRAVETIERLTEAGEGLMRGYAEAHRRSGLGLTMIRHAWRTVQDFPREVWRQALTPRWGEAKRGSFLDRLPGFAEFVAAILLECQGKISNQKLADIALGKFGLE